MIVQRQGVRKYFVNLFLMARVPKLDLDKDCILEQNRKNDVQKVSRLQKICLLMPTEKSVRSYR